MQTGTKREYVAGRRKDTKSEQENEKEREREWERSVHDFVNHYIEVKWRV